MTTANLRVEALKEAIAEKLVANAESVAKAKGGTLEWRWRGDTLIIELNPKL